MSSKWEIKKHIIGNSILGNEPFILEIKEKHLLKKEKEIPSVGKIHNAHCQIFMDILYRYTGLNNREIGKLMALDYSTVSVGRKRLRGD